MATVDHSFAPHQPEGQESLRRLSSTHPLVFSARNQGHASICDSAVGRTQPGKQHRLSFAPFRAVSALAALLLAWLRVRKRRWLRFGKWRPRGMRQLWRWPGTPGPFGPMRWVPGSQSSRRPQCWHGARRRERNLPLLHHARSSGLLSLQPWQHRPLIAEVNCGRCGMKGARARVSLARLLHPGSGRLDCG